MREQKTVELLTWSQPNPYHRENTKAEPTSNLKGEGTTDQLVFPCNGIYPVCETVTSSEYKLASARNKKTVMQLPFGQK